MSDHHPQIPLQPAPPASRTSPPDTSAPPAKKKNSRSSRDAAVIKRRCVSTACVACRRRKSKCDGNTPACAACSSVYGTECVYDPNSDHRRKGVYKEKLDSSKTKESTLSTIIQAILNATEDDVPALVRQIRVCESLDDVAEQIHRQEQGIEDEDDDMMITSIHVDLPTFENELSTKMGEMRIENGSIRFIGGTSNLIYLAPSELQDDQDDDGTAESQQHDDPLSSWTEATDDTELIVHLINGYFTWHYPYFTTLSKSLFYRDFLRGKPSTQPRRTTYCSSLLVNSMLALGCHFTNSPAACQDPNDSSTKGDKFFEEAKRLIVENDEFEKPRLTTVQALALMSVREAGCGREAKGWVYSGMSFRMALDMGLNLESGAMTSSRETMDEQEIDARRITFWGLYLFDKCWSNYLGRLPQIPSSDITVAKYDVFPDEDADMWSPYTDNGIGQLHSQASRTRTVALQICTLCEISSDLLVFFYHPHALDKPPGRAAELKKLSELHTRLEAWRKDLPRELEPKEGQLPNVLVMHMFFHLLYIHLFRPFLKYNPSTSPLPSHVSPRKLCTQAAALISKLFRLYKRTYGLRQICNIAVYIIHSACTIHLLNLPDKTAKRDIVHGVKHLEEIAEDWLCARRTLSVISVLARKWKIELPDEAATILARTDARFGVFSTADIPSPGRSDIATSPQLALTPGSPHQAIKSQQSSPVFQQVRGLQQFQAQSRHQSLDLPRLQTQSSFQLLNTIRSQQNSPQLQQQQSAPPQNQKQLTAMAALTTNPNSYNSQPPFQNPISIPPRPPTTTHTPTPIPSPRHPSDSSQTSLPPETFTQMSHPWASRHHPPNSRPSTTQPSATGYNSNITSTVTTRHTSPSGSMFGGIEALVREQEWWFREQDSLALGFGNWGEQGGFGSAGGGENGNGNGVVKGEENGDGWY